MPNAGTFMLEPLDPDEPLTLLGHLAGQGTLPPEACRRVAETAEGNPLFLEEIVGMLIEEGHLRRQGDGWVVSELATWTLSLVRKELPRSAETPEGGWDGFQFHHLLMRDVAYDSIPKLTRAELHERDADWAGVPSATRCRACSKPWNAAATSRATGSTSLGERLDPESLSRVMAVFGVPVVHEDDAVRAVRAAAELRAGLVAVNEDLARNWGMTLEVRTGVNTGEVGGGRPGACVPPLPSGGRVRKSGTRGGRHEAATRRRRLRRSSRPRQGAARPDRQPALPKRTI